jgi:hypothetical protein
LELLFLFIFFGFGDDCPGGWLGESDWRITRKTGFMTLELKNNSIWWRSTEGVKGFSKKKEFRKLTASSAILIDRGGLERSTWE